MTRDDRDQLSLLDLLEKPPIEALYSPDQIYESDDVTLFSRIFRMRLVEMEKT